MDSESPNIVSNLYASNALDFSNFGSLTSGSDTGTAAVVQDWGNAPMQEILRGRQPAQHFILDSRFEEHIASPNQQLEQIIMANTPRRIVQVFIADPNENVPLEDALIYKGDQKLTEATDQELYFEIPIVDLLKTHNEKRVKLVDKEASKRAGKDIFLDPVKIRELRMVVTQVAAF